MEEEEEPALEASDESQDEDYDPHGPDPAACAADGKEVGPACSPIKSCCIRIGLLEFDCLERPACRRVQHPKRTEMAPLWIVLPSLEPHGQIKKVDGFRVVV